MYIKPIPIEILCDTVIYKEIEEDAFGEQTIIGTYQLENVRVEANSNNSINKGDEVKNKRNGNTFTDYNYKLYYDSTNSKGYGGKFKLNGIIVYNGDSYSIVKVVDYKSFNSIHHYEIGLM